MIDKSEFNQLTEVIIGAAIAVHKELEPGLLESTYETCLAYELRERGCLVEVQKSLPVLYHNHRIESGFRLDILVNNMVIVEVKAIES